MSHLILIKSGERVICARIVHSLHSVARAHKVVLNRSRRARTHTHECTTAVDIQLMPKQKQWIHFVSQRTHTQAHTLTYQNHWVNSEFFSSSNIKTFINIVNVCSFHMATLFSESKKFGCFPLFLSNVTFFYSVKGVCLQCVFHVYVWIARIMFESTQRTRIYLSR